MPLRSDWSEDRCPIARSLDIVGDPWVLLILRQALSGVRRFDDFRTQIGVADTVLSRRLRGMVDAGLLRRSPYLDGNRTRQEYLLTEAGADLLPVLNQLTLWGEKHRPHTDPGVHMTIVHVGCGAVSDTAEVCSSCGQELTPDQVRWRKTWREGDLQLVGPG
ncbi:transcriptional regulator [Nakamurella sp. YIM 132087]|uniref:Transcriptional regulator n=1 Tax=Nakamurella alba TaxID=2665158 RepID=A0A7K1FKU8_9ACTN|nr:helix-turn-helix domain-containing protein [Nakamurella alba]MTD14772.1 transcriptional regulator [Nakamurella alba]